MTPMSRWMWGGPKQNLYFCLKKSINKRASVDSIVQYVRSHGVEYILRFLYFVGATFHVSIVVWNDWIKFNFTSAWYTSWSMFPQPPPNLWSPYAKCKYMPNFLYGLVIKFAFLANYKHQAGIGQLSRIASQSISRIFSRTPGYGHRPTRVGNVGCRKTLSKGQRGPDFQWYWYHKSGIELWHL